MMNERISELFGLEGRVALVTGGNSGIGKTIVKALASAGARVFLTARRESQLLECVQEFTQQGLTVAALPCDLNDADAIAGLRNRVAQGFGAPDIVVNAAGINPRKSFESNSEKDWDDTLSINLKAPFLLTQALAPAMRERGWGRIVNIASLQSARAFPDSAPYGASKGGVLQLTRAIAEHWSRHGVTCNAIAPGFFETPLTAAIANDPEKLRAMAQATMAGRASRLSDLEGAAIFLASEASAFVTGQTLFVDGGFSAR